MTSEIMQTIPVTDELSKGGSEGAVPVAHPHFHTGSSDDLALAHLAPRSVLNLRGGADRSRGEIRDQVHAAIDSEHFSAICLRLIDIRITDKARQQIDTLFKPKEDAVGSNRQELVVDLRELAHRIVDNSEATYTRLESLRKRDGVTKPLDPDEIHLGGVFEHKKNAKPEVRLYVAKSFSELVERPPAELITEDIGAAFTSWKIREDQTEAALAGELRKVMAEAVACSLVLCEQTLKYAGARIHSFGIHSLDLPWLDARSTRAIARASLETSHSAVRNYLLEVDSIPAAPLGFGLAHDHRDQRHNRFKVAAATHLARNPGVEPDGALQKTVQIFKELFSRDDILVHPFDHDNDGVVFDAIHAAVKRGHLIIAFPSCPDYSGEVVQDGGRDVWHYTFAELGGNTGITAKKGFDFVRAVHEVLTARDIALTIRHFECTYEVANGFTSKLPGREGDLDYAQAVARLSASNEAIRSMYAEAGIEIETCLTSQVIPDDQFTHRKELLVAELVEQAKRDPATRELIDRIATDRQVLYAEWHPPKEDEAGGVEGEAYQLRLRTNIVPKQVAEYLLLGEILSGAKPSETILLSYDSPKMWEVLARYPAMHGYGRHATNYKGA